MNICPVKRTIAALAALSFVWLGCASAANAEWVRCAEEHGYCATPYPTMVRYGAHGVYARVHSRGGGILCDNSVFGDPLVGVYKHCEFWAGN
ncbi:MAG: hypothetical protein ACLPWS_15405 [Rhodomicrobium sp.]